ncbi:MAG: class I SAM-dependent methyltransferase [bacterium]|nr:class I SAM-dependent methyltransferase [bacterium]
MNDLNKSIVSSLDGRDMGLMPYLPYLLQDLWEIGTFPEEIIGLLEKHNITAPGYNSVLDLGSGKGAVSVKLAVRFGFEVHGIDGTPEFIAEAEKWAEKYRVMELCDFELGDMRLLVEDLQDYDIAILGSIGPIFGNIEESLTSVKKCLKPGGIIVLDDGYIEDDSIFLQEGLFKRSETMKQIAASGIEVLDEIVYDSQVIKDANTKMNAQIRQRAAQLTVKHPAQKKLFDDYSIIQEEESAILENSIKCATWLLRT